MTGNLFLGLFNLKRKPLPHTWVFSVFLCSSGLLSGWTSTVPRTSSSVTFKELTWQSLSEVLLDRGQLKSDSPFHKFSTSNKLNTDLKNLREGAAWIRSTSYAAMEQRAWIGLFEAQKDLVSPILYACHLSGWQL